MKIQARSSAAPLLNAVAFAGVLSFLILLRGFYGYLPFHVFAELFSIVVFFSVFLFCWNSYHRIENGFIKLVGISFLFIGFIDIVHTLTFKGMNLIPGYDVNTPTQLWIAARALQATTILIGLFLINKKLSKMPVFVSSLIITSLLLASILFWGIFPDCFIDGKLTPFKIAAEYVISLLLALSILVLHLKKKKFDDIIFRYLILSLAATILSELAFTLYEDVYDIMNFSGHFLKILAAYLLNKTVIEIGLRKPFDLVFKDLKQREQDLGQALSKVKTLTGLLPICASCKKIRDDSGYWSQVEEYITEHSDAQFSHGLCPDCFNKYQLQIDREEKEKNG